MKRKIKIQALDNQGCFNIIKQRDKIYQEMVKAKNSQTKQLKLILYKKHRNI